MEDHKNHLFISNSDLRKFSLRILLFVTPILMVYGTIEIYLHNRNFREHIIADYIQKNVNNIEVLFLGSSQTQRAINPKLLSFDAVNIANSSQTIFEDSKLLYHFEPKLPNLNIVVIELSYDILDRGKTYVLPFLDYLNYNFYNTNTFGRDLRIQDNFLFHSEPDYFAEKIKNDLFNNSNIKLNKYGFDENKFDGAYSYADYILIENADNPKVYQKNLATLFSMINYCLEHKLKILIYCPPTYEAYNNLRAQELLQKWKDLLNRIHEEHPTVEFFIDDTNPNFTKKFFDDANHLNPNGAEKATKIIDSVIKNTFKEISLR